MDDRNQNQNPEHRSDALTQPEPDRMPQNAGEDGFAGANQGQPLQDSRPPMPNQPDPGSGPQPQNLPDQNSGPQPQNLPDQNSVPQPQNLPDQNSVPQPPNQPGQNPVPPQNQYGSMPPQNDPYYNPYYQAPPPGNYRQPNYQNQPPIGNPYDPYRQPDQQNQPPQKAPVNSLAVTSMVLGIISLLISCCCLPIGFIGGFAIGMAGLATAIISKKGQPFSPFAIAGLVVSILGICGSLLIFGCYIMTAQLMKDPEYAALINQILQQYYNGN